MSDIKVGDRVRSYDFARDRNCYQEGRVRGFHEGHTCRHYEIVVDYVVWEGTPEPVPDGHVIRPPVNGTPTNRGRVTDFVVKL